MRAIIQRVNYARVTANNKVIGKIEKGLFILLGVGPNDTQKEIDYLSRKIINMRIFEDENEKMNFSVKDIQGELLVVSQFTLFADCKKGNRPSFTQAGPPDKSKKLYLQFIDACKKENIPTSQGKFGADMNIELLNQGPVTIYLDTNQLL